eukprot:4410264-Prymnesium_polylepis.1
MERRACGAGAAQCSNTAPRCPKATRGVARAGLGRDGSLHLVLGGRGLARRGGGLEELNGGRGVLLQLLER